MADLTIITEINNPDLPEFTSSTTLAEKRPKSQWINPQETIKRLEKNGVKLSAPTLFNLERRGKLTTQRISARKIFFDWAEVSEHFNITEK